MNPMTCVKSAGLALAAVVALAATGAAAEPFQGLQVGVGLGAGKYHAKDKIAALPRRSDGKATGFNYRAFAGYDTHVGSRFVVGGEVGVSGGGKDVDSRVDTARVTVDPGLGFDVSARAGVLATDRVLLYGRVGYARQKFDREVRLPGSAAVLKSDKTEGGKLFGVGAEYAVTDNVALRAEYDRSDFSKDRKRDRFMVSAAYRF